MTLERVGWCEKKVIAPFLEQPFTYFTKPSFFMEKSETPLFGRISKLKPLPSLNEVPTMYVVYVAV